jgi:hypothetical protein
MAMGVKDLHSIAFGRESVAFEQSYRGATLPAATTQLAPRPYRATPDPLGRSASAEAPHIVPQERSTEEVAVWIQVLLRLESEMPLAHLAEELGFSDR